MAITPATDQLSLFDLSVQPCVEDDRRATIPPFQRHSQTSRESALAVMPQVSGLRAQVLDAIIAHDGLTDEEGQAITGITGNTYRPRRIELQRAGHIVDSGKTRAGASGRESVVWVRGAA
jgi:hypothetical protein